MSDVDYAGRLPSPSLLQQCFSRPTIYLSTEKSSGQSAAPSQVTDSMLITGDLSVVTTDGITRKVTAAEIAEWTKTQTEVESSLVTESSSLVQSSLAETSKVDPTAKQTEVELIYEEIHRIFPTYDRRNADFYFSLFASKGFLEEAEKYVDDVLALHAGDNVSVALDKRYKGNLNAAELLYKHGAEIRIGHYNVHLCNSARGVDIFMKYINSTKLNEYLTQIDVYGRVCNGSYLFIMGHSLETIKHIIEKYPHVLKYSNVFCTDETKKHTPQAKTYEVFEELVKFYGTEMLYEYTSTGRQLSEYGTRWPKEHNRDPIDT